MMMIVISALVGAVILSYCLTGKKTKKPAIIAGIVFAVIMNTKSQQQGKTDIFA